jgi:hypothetical protein
MKQDLINVILNAQHLDGFWERPGGGLAPSYTSSIWQVIFLAELGADPDDERVKKGCCYLLEHSQALNGGFSISPKPRPSSVLHCTNGDLVYALVKLGFLLDTRVQAALDWQVEAVLGSQGFKYFKSGTCGAGYCCRYNSKLPCAWGAVKALKAFSSIPEQRRFRDLERAIEITADFLLSKDLVSAEFPTEDGVSKNWFKFGFPLNYQSDLLEAAGALVDAGYGADARLAKTISFIEGKQNNQGMWIMEKSLNGKMWVDIEERGKPSRLLTRKAKRILANQPDV